MKILLAVDGSAYTKKMLAYLTTHDMLSLDNQYTALTVHMVLPAQARSALGKEAVKKYYEDEAEKISSPVSKFLLRHGIRVKWVNRIGNPGEHIAKLAQDEKFDLIIMGSHGHSALGSLIMGSATTSVLAHCKVPLLIVR
jgi:nucleotide-binding universal stress UspA family protein